MDVDCDLQEQCSRSFVYARLFLWVKRVMGLKGKRLTTARMFSLIRKDDVRTYPMRPNARTCTRRNT